MGNAGMGLPVLGGTLRGDRFYAWCPFCEKYHVHESKGRTFSKGVTDALCDKKTSPCYGKKYRLYPLPMVEGTKTASIPTIEAARLFFNTKKFVEASGTYTEYTRWCGDKGYPCWISSDKYYLCMDYFIRAKKAKNR